MKGRGGKGYMTGTWTSTLCLAWGRLRFFLARHLLLSMLEDGPLTLLIRCPRPSVLSVCLLYLSRIKVQIHSLLYGAYPGRAWVQGCVVDSMLRLAGKRKLDGISCLSHVLFF